MSARVERAAEWVYQGLWGVLASWFNVPRDPPTLPGASGQGGDGVRTFKPAREFLAYRKFYFWVLLTLIDGALTIGWVALLIVAPLVGAILFPVYLGIAVIPDIIAYIAIHLRYDTTWYVLSDRSMRIRRGIWIIHETTITYENIQNVGVRQGPIQRCFGIATLTVHTAGGGGGGGGGGPAGKGGHGAGMAGAHVGIIEGITDARQLRDQLMARVERSRATGLGDERAPGHARGHGGIELSPAHVALLAEIRELLRGSTGAAN